ncbi:MAG: hypothetical protein AB7G23_12235 [Vicinamibacterales bacterium]
MAALVQTTVRTLLRGPLLVLLLAGIGGSLSVEVRAQEAKPQGRAQEQSAQEQGHEEERPTEDPHRYGVAHRRSRPITETAERVARELWPTDVRAIEDTDDERPRFRASVTVELPPLPPPWYDPDAPTVQQRGTLYHREFLASVTPEAFRASQLVRSTGGVSVDPGTMFDPIKRTWREWQARRIRARIQEELAHLRVVGDDAEP